MKKFIIFLILIIGCISFFNISYANQLSADCKASILSNLQKLYDQNVLNETCYNAMVTKVNNFGSSGHTYTKYALIIGQGNINNYQGKLDTNRAIYIALTDDSYSQFMNYPVSTSNQVYNSWVVQSNGSGYMATISGLLSTGSNPSGNLSQYNQLQPDLYCYAYNININTRTVTLGSGEEVGGNYLVEHPPVFTPSTSNGYVNVNNNGVTVAIPRLTFSYTGQSYYLLGYLSNYKDNDKFYNLEGNFGPYVSGDIIDSSMASFHFDYDNGVLNGSLIFDYDSGGIYIKASRLIDLQTYNLLLQYSAYNGQYQDLGSFDYYAVYYTTNVTSGELISPDLNSTVDIGFVNALDDFFNNNDLTNQNNQYILNNNFPSLNFSGDSSGDYVLNISGDFFGISYTDNDHWGFGDLVFWFIKSFINMLTNYNNVTINFGFLGDINSSQFLINNTTITNFISLFSNTLFIIILVFYYFKFIHSVSTLDFEKLQNFEVDNFFNLF